MNNKLVVSVTMSLVIGFALGIVFSAVVLRQLGILAPQPPSVTRTEVQTAYPNSSYPAGKTEAIICAQNVQDQTWAVRFRIYDTDDGTGSQSEWIYASDTKGKEVCTSFYLPVGHYLVIAQSMNSFSIGSESVPKYFGVIASQVLPKSAE